jgi:oxygen-independent coproporphyrinogen-3 oxidase
VQPRELLIREMILQLKTGRLDAGYFQSKFGVRILADYAEGFAELAEAGFLTLGAGEVKLTEAGFLQVDRLLPVLFESHYQGSRYT